MALLGKTGGQVDTFARAVWPVGRSAIWVIAIAVKRWSVARAGDRGDLTDSSALLLVPTLTVAENMWCWASEPRRFGLLVDEKARAKMLAALSRHGLACRTAAAGFRNFPSGSAAGRDPKSPVSGRAALL